MEYQHIYVISKFSPIFPKGFKEFFPWHIYTSPDFFPIEFLKDLFDWLQDHKKTKLITRPQEEQIDQEGVLWRKLD